MSGTGSKLESMISWVLIIGVVASLLFESIGLLLGYAQAGDSSVSFTTAWQVNANNFFSFVSSSLRSVGNPSPMGVVALGVILLMLTPYVRVIVSVLYFGETRDVKYFGITLLVLSIITLSLAAR